MPSSTRRPVYLAELSYPAVARLQAQQPIVLLPIGATEAHGPHLPLLTDVYLSDAWARRTQQALWQRGIESLIAPALPYAVTEYGADFSGTVSLDAETAERLYAAVLKGLLRTGFSSLCVLNSHLEPAHIAALRSAVARLQQEHAGCVAFPDQTEKRFARMLTDEYKRGNCHAGRYETALLLACQPQLVDEERRATLPENPADLVGAMRAGIADFASAGGPLAYFGSPAAATVQEGDAIYARLVEIALLSMSDTWPTRLRPEAS
ncbi:MAG: creatininase family protein [Myxococcales bacterium]|nr:creatininase family protein [Myxococcales bacterium]